jgi:hypothetical protein
MPNCSGQTASRIVAECTGCAGFCGDQELYLADMELSRAGQPAIVMFRSWRCLIRHAMKQHALSREPYPAVRCSNCGRPGLEDHCDPGNDPTCSGVFRQGWEDLT